ncbi:BNR repeat-like domain protein [Candidatus Tiddalikarchaeum anstoanum]|nr:BNR repeat-like domain protein [Candidatus Tiddalikarchaeum anstoanum]
MRKAITPIIATTLLVLITIVATSAAFFWVTAIQTSMQESAGSAILGSVSGCSRINLISMMGDKVIVQNTGCDDVTNVTLLIDGVLTSYGLSTPLSPGGSAIISFSNLLAGMDHCVKVLLSNGGESQLCSSASRNTLDAGYGYGCLNSSECGSGESCCNHVCFNPCDNDTECGSGFSCINPGSCTAYCEEIIIPGCTNNSECDDSNVCTNDLCGGGSCTHPSFANGQRTGCTGTTGCAGTGRICSCMSGNCSNTCGDGVCQTWENSGTCSNDCILTKGILFNVGGYFQKLYSYNSHWDGYNSWIGFSGFQPDVVVDKNNNILYLVYIDSSALMIRNATFTMDWSDPVEIVESARQTTEPSITIDDNGEIWVAYSDHESGSNGIYVKHSSDGITWSSEITVVNDSSNPMYDYPSIVQTRTGYGIVMTKTTGMMDYTAMWTSSSDGLTWNTPEEITPIGMGSKDTDLLADDEGNLYATFIDTTGIIRKSIDNGTTWTTISDDSMRWSQMYLIQSNDGKIVGLSHDGMYPKLYYSLDKTNFQTYDLGYSLVFNPSDFTFFQLPNDDYVAIADNAGLVIIYMDGLGFANGMDSDYSNWVRDNTGVIHTIYSYPSMMANEIRYTNSTDGLIFSTPITLNNYSPNSNIGYFIDNSDVCHIVFSDSSIKIFNATDCYNYGAAESIMSCSMTCKDPVMIQDNSNKYVMAYFDDMTAIKVSYATNPYDAGNWSAPVSISDWSHYEPHLIQDNNNVYWLVMRNSMTSLCAISNSTDAFTWSEPVDISTSSTICSYPVIFQDDAHNYHIIYNDLDMMTGGIKEITSNDGITWSSAEQINTNPPQNKNGIFYYVK